MIRVASLSLCLTLGLPALLLAEAKVNPVAPPSADAVRAQVISWVAGKSPSPETVAAVGKLWVFEQTPPAEELFERAVRSFALADADTKTFVEACGLSNAPLVPPDAKTVIKDGDNPFYLATMRVFYGKYLVQRTMYDEALDVLAPVKVTEAIDPATLLFSRAVCQHQLQQKVEGLSSIEQLLQVEGIPVRYSTVAALMQFDLEQVAEQPGNAGAVLDALARKMWDVERRLALGRSGPKVQKKEAEIVAGLDELIKKIEEQQGGGGGGDSSNNTNKSSSAAKDSRVKGSTAPGNVDPKKFQREGTWGQINEKDRPKAQQLIGRHFPSHYEKVIEEYTRKAAARELNEGQKEKRK